MSKEKAGKQEVSLGGILNCQDSLKELGQIRRLPARTSFFIAQLLLEMNTHFQTINEVRNKMIAELGEKDETGQTSIKANTPAFVKFTEDIQELLKETVEIKDYNIFLPPDVEVSPQLLLELRDFVKVEGC